VASALAVAALGPGTGVLVSTLVMTFLVLVFCEVLPKAFAATHPKQVSRLVALPLYLFHGALRPVHHVLARSVDTLIRRMGGGAEAGDDVTAEEVLALARRAGAQGNGAGPTQIMSAAAHASEMTVQEIMVERPDIVAFPVETPPAELLDKMIEERYTRIPVYEGSIDHMEGIVHFKDLVRHVRSQGKELRHIVRPVLRVPERKPILPLLTEMQHRFVHLAIVKDEHAITQGLVTTEDILEELVGEIRDEYDEEELRSIRPQNDGFEALGRVKVLDFNRATGWEIPSERGDTLSGLVFNHLGRAPLRGDVIRLSGYEIIVTDVSGTRIARLVLRRHEEAGDEGEGDDAQL
jgi:CBS domain containing-hemolysin-like protein